VKVKRNDPCPCGSGRKYKKCCLDKEQQTPDLLWRRLRETDDKLSDRMLRLAQKAFGSEALAVAYNEFLLWPEEEPEEEVLDRHFQTFMPWFVFNWVYDPRDVEVKLSGPADTTVAELYARRQGKRLDALEARFIEATSRRPYSFVEVLQCRPGVGFQVRDLLVGEEIDVLERSGSEGIRPGDILFCRVSRIEHVAMLVGCSSFAIPPRFKPDLIRLRKWLRKGGKKITSDILNEYDTEIREVYLVLGENLFQPPVLVNTDGDSLSFHKMFYEIDDPEEAFIKLHTLCVTETVEELRSLAAFDENGRISRVEIPWTRKGFAKSNVPESTLLGTLTINGTTLQVEVNSQNRAETIKKEIQKRLGAGARHMRAEIESLAAALAKGEEKKRKGKAARESDDLMEYPEVQEHLRQMIAGNWQSWMDERIPALGGKTPRKAVRSADGREMVESLLVDAERDSAYEGQLKEAELAAISKVRLELGLSIED
jgi:hypothetical protein